MSFRDPPVKTAMHVIRRILKRNIIFTAVGVVVLGGGFAAFCLLRAPDPPVKPDTPVASGVYRMKIEGLRFFGMNRGRKAISITADRFTLGRGKIGFFSAGFIRKARIENAVIEIYSSADAKPSRGSLPREGGLEKPEPQSPATAVAGRFFQEGGLKKTYSPRNLDFKGLFADETLSSLLPVRNIAQIEISPIAVRLRTDEAILTEVFAMKAVLLPREKKVLFTGRVRVVSGNAELTTEQLVFIPETATLHTDRPYALKRGEFAVKGTALTSDIFLLEN